MKKRIWIGVLLVLGLTVLGGCGKKEKTSGQEKSTKQTKEDASNKTEETPAVTGSSEEDGSLGLDEESMEVLPDSADTEQEKSLRGDIAAQLPFSGGDDKVCAIVYLGKETKQQEKALQDFFEQYVPDYTAEQIAVLPRVDNQGKEAYLIIPRYQACEISVNRLEKQTDGNVQVILDAEKPEGAFILICNPSQEFSNAEVNIAYQAKVHVVVPRLSPVNNQLESMQVALDLTDEAVYQ